MNRRKFLAAGTAAACACSLGTSLGAKVARAATGDTNNKKLRVRVIYALYGAVQPRPTWPHVGFDFRPVMQKFNHDLAKAFPSIEFVPCMADGKKDAKAILAKDKSEKVDGYIVFQMNNWPKVIRTVVAGGKPTLFVDYLYGGSGGFLARSGELIAKETRNFGVMASSQFEDVVRAVSCFQTCTDPNGFADAVTAVRKACTPKMSDAVCKPDAMKPLPLDEWKKQYSQSKILAFKDNKPSNHKDRDFAGIPLVYLPFSELNEAWKAADRDQAKEIAAQWAKGADKIVDVSQAELENSAAMYLGQKAILKKYDADAITINCLGGFYGGHIHAYPCLGFHQLCNDGLVGACECDIWSTATMLAIKTLTGGRPGFISDPVLDVATREIIYAHCVASNHPFGPQGPANPYEILTHSEDRKGAAVRSFLPKGYMTTTLKMMPEKKTILFHQAKTSGNSTEDKACRTKLKAEVIGDFDKLFAQWNKTNWHRVTVYGDIKDQVYGMADTLGWKVHEET
jgi:hypothetical protein